jgi:hypothetical protein
MGQLLAECNLGSFPAENNLTEINHKVSVPAKWFRDAIPAAFAGK